MNSLYIYLSSDNYSTDHVDMMKGMIDCLEKAGEVEIQTEKEREDLNAYEYEIKATTWGMEFLNHMDNCDMLQVVASPF